jgi:hypothetical protein
MADWYAMLLTRGGAIDLFLPCDRFLHLLKRLVPQQNLKTTPGVGVDPERAGVRLAFIEVDR